MIAPHLAAGREVVCLAAAPLTLPKHLTLRLIVTVRAALLLEPNATPLNQLNNSLDTFGSEQKLSTATRLLDI